MDAFLSLIFEPVKQFLVDQGAWSVLVELYETVSVLTEKIMALLGIQITAGSEGGGISALIIEGLKLSMNIFVTLIKVLIDIVNWVVGLF